MESNPKELSTETSSLQSMQFKQYSVLLLLYYMTSVFMELLSYGFKQCYREAMPSKQMFRLMELILE